MSDTKPHDYLKESVRRRTRPVLGVGALAVAWVNLGAPLAIAELPAPNEASWVWRVLPPLMSIAVMILDSLPGERAKAVLVFWRWKSPLPGSRAFEKRNLDEDTRIDRQRLREFAGGTLPRAAGEQNKLWYRLYRSVEADARVREIHKEYLTLRDLTWFSILLLMAALVSAAALRTVSTYWLVGTLSGVYILVRRAAAERGVRFVATVLAVVSSQPDSARGSGSEPAT